MFTQGYSPVGYDLSRLKSLSSLTWELNPRLLTVDMPIEHYSGRFRLRLDTKYFPASNLSQSKRNWRVNNFFLAGNGKTQEDKLLNEIFKKLKINKKLKRKLKALI